ncbi:hypothetical protein [Streptomyces sp. NPDC001381]|uniref:hypothetical protein n=1 Tax=Streptomyces sp. NPDC001381 TaxID=3364567 RepID=UPI00367CD935
MRDGVFTVALAPVAFAPVTAPLGAEFGDLTKRPYDVPGVLAVLLLWLPWTIACSSRGGHRIMLGRCGRA